MIKILLSTVIIAFVGCKQRPSQIVITDFNNGLRYEQLVDLNNGTRVITKTDDSDGSFVIIIPGDILWCEYQEGRVYGQKVGQQKPAHWMDPSWGKAGYFSLNPSKLRMNAATDEDRVEQALEWFSRKDELIMRLNGEDEGASPAKEPPK